LKKYFFISVLFTVVHTLTAQDSISVRYPALWYVQQTEAWLSSYNASGLRFAPAQQLSEAEIFVNKGDGGFVNYYQSDNSYEWGASAESYHRLNGRVNLYGKINYSNFTGQNMTGSAFIDPDYNAFNLSEMADSTRGKKNMETFTLIGGIGADWGHGFSWGGKINYRTANYAKYRDLRHTNKLLDLTASAGVSYQILSLDNANGALIIGGCYLYRRSVEGLSFNMYGVTDKQYFTLIDFGGFYGNSELWSTSGSKSYTSDGEPMFNEFNGGALQLNWRLQNRWDAFGEIAYLNRSGYYGKKSPNTYVFTDHKGTDVSMNGRLTRIRLEDRHSLSVQAGMERLENYELISQEENTQGNRTSIVYTGKNQVLSRNRTRIEMEYTGSFGIRDFCPAWQFKAGGEYTVRDQTVSVYPYYRLQNIWSYSAFAGVNRNIRMGKNQYGILLETRYGVGGGTPKDDRTYIPPSSQQKPPKSLNNFLYQEYEYLTAPRLAISTALEYARFIQPSLCAYVHLTCNWTHATKAEYVSQKSFIFASLSFGCRF
jgi:hypothetical protein